MCAETDMGRAGKPSTGERYMCRPDDADASIPFWDKNGEATTRKDVMTDQDDTTTGAGESKQQRWFAEVQEALDRTGDALRTAWEATRDSRMSALESAKQAAQELGEVIDQGIAAAKERWAAADQTEEAETPIAEETTPDETSASDAEPIPMSGDVTVTPVESDPSEQT